MTATDSSHRPTATATDSDSDRDSSEYVFAIGPAFRTSLAVTGAAFFLVGAGRSLVTDRSWLYNGAEMFVVGMLAASVAFVGGDLLKGLA